MKSFKHLRCGIVSMPLVICALSSAVAQSPPAKSLPDPRPDFTVSSDLPKAVPADVSSIQNIVKAFYSAISAPAGGKLDRKRLHSLFVPSGRIAVGLPPNGSHPADILFLTPDEYAQDSDSQTAKEGFFDANPANQIEQFGVMAHVYSTYESRSHLEDAKPMARGIKSFELLHRADRWYIVQVYWDAECPDNPLPERYLHDGTR